MTIDPRLHRIVAAQPYPLLFATISGAHLYGFPSSDSDYDLRGAHVLPLEQIVGLEARDETVEQSMIVPADTDSTDRACHSVRADHGSHTDGAQGTDAPYHDGPLDMDIVSHDVKKFFGLLLRNLLENSKWCCGEGFWLWPRRRDRRIPAVGCNGGTNAGHGQKNRRPLGFSQKERSGFVAPRSQTAAGMLPRRALPYRPFCENSAPWSFQTDSRKNGYVLEQLFSPPIVHTTPKHGELKAICCSGRESAHSDSTKSQSRLTSAATGVITKHHAHHYFGFAETQWKLFLKESPRRVKPLLYVYRVLLTGIHLMRTGVIEAKLVTLNEEFRLPYIAELIQRKTTGENTTLSDADLTFHESEYDRLRGELQSAHEVSQLPERPDEATRAALNDLLVRIRLNPPKPKG